MIDPYEEWKAQGRPGGSFSAWQAGQAAVPTQAAPGAFSQAWMDQGLAAYNAGQRGSDPNATPGFNPATFRQTYAGMQGGGRPEDLARFSDATLAGWMPFYDPQTGKYRSMRGAEGWFDKPTECPPGQMPSGPNETDPCMPNPAQPAQPAAPVATPAAQPLQQVMAGLQTPAPNVSGGSVSAPVALPQVQSSLQSILTPYQAQGRPAAAQQAPAVGRSQWTSTSGFRPLESPLQDVLARRQRTGRPGAWF